MSNLINKNNPESGYYWGHYAHDSVEDVEIYSYNAEHRILFVMGSELTFDYEPEKYILVEKVAPLGTVKALESIRDDCRTAAGISHVGLLQRMVEFAYKTAKNILDKHQE